MRSELLRVNIAAQRLGVSRQMVYKYFKIGVLKYVRLPSGGRRIRQSDLDEFIASLDQNKPKYWDRFKERGTV